MALTGVAVEETALAAEEIGINAANFPDEKFREYVSESFDKDKNGALSETEIKNATVLGCSGKQIKDLTGIEKFTNLYSLI